MKNGRMPQFCGTLIILELFLLAGSSCREWSEEAGGRDQGEWSGGRPVIVHVEPALSLALTDMTRVALEDHTEDVAQPRMNLGRSQAELRERTPIVYFYSRGAKQMKNRGAEVFHQLHEAVRREGIVTFLEDGVEEYRTELSQYVEDADEVFASMGKDDVVVVTAIPHALNANQGILLPSYSGAPHLAAQGMRVVKWQIGYSFPSISYFVDEDQHMICDTHFLKDVMGCVKEAVLRAPPLPLYYKAAEEARREVGGGSLSPLKERLVLYDNDHELDTSQLRLNGGCILQKLDGMSRQEMISAYRRAIAVIDLWLPGAETVTAEGAMFDCCVLVSNEMNGAHPIDFPIPSEFKIDRDPVGTWNYTQISDLLNRALDDYDSFVQHFKPLKDHVMALPSQFQSSVHRYFSNDAHFVGSAFSLEEQELAMPWVLSVLMNFPLASIQLVVPNRYQFGLAAAPVLEVLRQRGLRQSLMVTDPNSNGLLKWQQTRDDSPRVFVHHTLTRQRAITCFFDVRASLLRPDLLSSLERGKGTSEREGPHDDGEISSSRESERRPQRSKHKTFVECSQTSDYMLIPADTEWIDLAELNSVHSWDGMWVLEDSDQGYEMISFRAGLSSENCAHLHDLYTNKVYASAFVYFSKRYRRAMHRELKGCGYEL